MKAINLNKWIAVLALLPLVLGMQVKAQNIICAGTEYCVALDDNRGSEQWQMSTDGVTFTDLPGETGDSLCITPTMSGFYRAVITTEPGCAPIFSDTIELQLSDLSVDAGLDQRICAGDSAMIGVGAGGGAGGYSYQWTGDGVGNPTSAMSNASPAASGDLVLTVTDTDGCSASDTVSFIVDPIPAPGDSTFEFTANEQFWVVPRCVDSVWVELWGAEGGAGSTLLALGGQGGYVQGSLAVSFGDTIFVYVGGKNNTFNGGGTGGTGDVTGGTGGGASDIRLNGNTVLDRIMVAGGGGGGGTQPGGGPAGGVGGAGGGTTGSAGANDSDSDPNIVSNSTGGGGGTPTDGGIGGSGMVACNATAGAGGAGQGSAQGGIGGNGGDGVTPGMGSSCLNFPGAGGGGGGGGYTGGGGGGGGAGGFRASSGGGGGSSFLDTSVITGGTTMAGQRVGNGQVTIHW